MPQAPLKRRSLFHFGTVYRAVAMPLMLALLLSACASEPPSIVTLPTVVRPAPPPHVEQVVNGAIFQPYMSANSLFAAERPARTIGDVVKVQIAETLNASQKLKNETSRENKVTSKGPGSTTTTGLYGKLMNLDASASGTDTFKGDGATDTASSFNGQISAQVINVLPNGHLVVAGERSIALNGGVSTLRFSGVVDPHDIKPGNLVASSDAADAKVELVSRGDVTDAGRRSWLQRVLSRTLSVW